MEIPLNVERLSDTIVIADGFKYRLITRGNPDNLDVAGKLKFVVLTKRQALRVKRVNASGLYKLRTRGKGLDMRMTLNDREVMLEVWEDRKH